MNDVETVFGGWDNEWTSQNEQEGPPDGTYIAWVAIANTEVDHYGNPAVTATLKIVCDTNQSTEHFGKPLAYSRSIRDSKSVYWMKMDLKHMGLEVQHSHEIPSRIREVIHAFVLVELKTNGKYKNVYIQDAAARPEKVLEKMKQQPSTPKSPTVYQTVEPAPVENDFADSIDPKAFEDDIPF